MKYYNTLIHRLIIPESLLEKWGWKKDRAYQIVVKAKSFAEANRKTEEWFGRKLFVKGYTYETGNAIQIQLCDQYGAIISREHAWEEEDYCNLFELIEALKKGEK